MKGLNETLKFWWASYLVGCEQTFSNYQIKCFCEINEGNIQLHILLSAFFLQLLN